jgi:hypothetical protein
VSSSAARLPATIDQARLKLVMEAAERHCDKLDACAVLDLLPKNVPVGSVVKFVSMAMESAMMKRHNLQVREGLSIL